MAASNPFTTVRTEGGLLPPDLLARIAAGDRDLGGVDPTDYGLSANDRLGDAASRAWNRAKAYWQSFSAMRESLRAEESGVTETREQWVFPLLRELGFDRPEFRAAAEELGGRRYPIQHRSGPVPLHIVSFRQSDLDRSVATGVGQPRVSPHALVQEYLNRSDDSLYGIVTNGLNLRLLHDNQSMSRLAYLDFDLEGMLEGGVYADFVLLFLTLHRSRLPSTSVNASDCWLEKWREKAETQGTRALGELRTGIERAIEALGNGLLAHPSNTQLRDALTSGTLTTLDYYAELLRIIYRLIFLFVAEERDLLHPDDADPRMKARYRENYSATGLREVARRHRTDERHDDLWRALRVTFDILAGRRTGLDLVALDGLFAPDSCPNLDRAQVANHALAEAVLQLSNVRVAKRVRRVNYRDIGAEELGGVYEGLLDRQPRVTVDAPPGKQFELIGSGERKSTGSYYTPDSLVQELIKSALVPVLEDRLSKAGKSREAQEKALLGISVCDTACGSGHFLLAAARRLGAELARVRAEDREPGPKDRRAAQRDVVRHCLYGVDVNPLSVDLCRLSLWMESYDSGRPLSFLDHHIKVGNSLIGATPELVAQGIPDDAFDPIGDDDKDFARRIKKRNREEKRQMAFVTSSGELSAEWSSVAEALARESREIDALPDADAEDVLAARQQYDEFTRSHVDPLRERLDAWTAAFFWTLKPDNAPPPTSGDLSGRRVALAAEQSKVICDVAQRNRFFHWQLEFPEVFDGGGFDCVLGNPPWERIKLQEQEFFAERDPEIAKAPNKAAREKLIKALSSTPGGLSVFKAFQDAKRSAEGASKFAQVSGRFPRTAIGDVNVFALFAEHYRAIINRQGRAGIIVPTGIATDDTFKGFFGDLLEQGSIVSLHDFQNRDLFPGVGHGVMRFCLLTLASLRTVRMDLSFFSYSTDHLHDERRHITLRQSDFDLMNPNTRTCPIFRTSADADLVRAIYDRVPVLINEEAGRNTWGLTIRRLFDMNKPETLKLCQVDDGETPVSRGDLLPMMESKLIHQFDTRWATYERTGPATYEASRVPASQKIDPNFKVRPRYWIPTEHVRRQLYGGWDKTWLIGWRDICRATDERTTIATILPLAGTDFTIRVGFPQLATEKTSVAALLANLNSIVLDYVVRQKLTGIHLSDYIIKQVPVIPPEAYTAGDLSFISPRVCELLYVTWDQAPLACDLGYDGPPYKWDAGRRAILRTELDAYYAAIYGLTRDELRYILDPQDVYGPDFPSETFRVVKEREFKAFGTYRTRDLILNAWDRLGLEPRNRDGRYDAGPPAAQTNGTAPRRAEQVPTDEKPTAEPIAREPALLNRQTVRERARTSARALPLSPSDPAPAVRTSAPTVVSQSPAPTRNRNVPTRPAPPAQSTLPGFTGGSTELRQRVLNGAIDALRRDGALTGREIAQRLAKRDSRIDRHLVNSVLSREGAALVVHNAISGKYSLKSR